MRDHLTEHLEELDIRLVVFSPSDRIFSLPQFERTIRSLLQPNLLYQVSAKNYYSPLQARTEQCFNISDKVAEEMKAMCESFAQ